MQHLVSITILFALLLVGAGYSRPVGAELLAGVSSVSITPLEEGIATQLGGYGARAGKPAEGVHDTIKAKTIVFDWKGTKAAVVTLDVCSVPIGLLEEGLAKAQVEGLSVDNVLMPASHSHAGIEGFSLDRRNFANNPYIGIFSEEVLAFVTDRVAQGIQEAAKALRPVTAASGVAKVAGFNRNRRGDKRVDDALTVLRLDVDGKPCAVLVNFTAHGTIMTEKEMLISGGWAGNMQRTVEALLGDGVTCLYTNGAEGDMSPAGAQGGSRWEMAEDYGRRLGLEVVRLAEALEPRPVETFALRSKRAPLPARIAPPGFAQIAGDEYQVDEAVLDGLLNAMLPGEAPIYALRIDDFVAATFPGEAICDLGLSVKGALREAGIPHPCVLGLTSEYIGYILTQDEYHQTSYETTVSFYGDGLGQLLLDEITPLALSVAQPR